mgnify:CR=1 FL=1
MIRIRNFIGWRRCLRILSWDYLRPNFVLVIFRICGASVSEITTYCGAYIGIDQITIYVLRSSTFGLVCILTQVSLIVIL